MRDSALRLQDKTIFLVGPFNGITQAILRTMTEFGADVGYVCEQGTHQPARYIDGLNEAREAKPEYGRAAYFDLPLSNEKQIQEALGRIVGTLGRMDSLIDATPLGWTAQTNPQAAVDICLSLADKIIPFLLAKTRGRVVYLFEDSCLEALNAPGASNGGREVLISTIAALAKKHRAQNLTVNGLSLGVTDDFLLKMFPKSGSLKKSFAELQVKHTEIRLVDFHEIGMSAAYLTSALSGSVTGQVLRLTHGAQLG